MSVKKEPFGQTAAGEAISIYTIDNGTISARIIDYGANLVNLMVPDRNGTIQDVILGFDDLEGYQANPEFYGALVGPVANRTAGACAVIDGREYHMTANEGENNLHSDADRGLHKRKWRALSGADFVTFTLELGDGELGLPGRRFFSVTYSVTDLDALSIHYHVTSDRATLINPTNHAYFNLNGHNSGSVAQQELQILASHFTPVDAASIPTGEIRSVAGTAFDFRESKPIGRDIDAGEEQLRLTGGYDHNFCCDGWTPGGSLRLIAKAFSGKSGREMSVYTTLPGVQFYAGNMVNCTEGRGKEHSNYARRGAFCLETQYYPDAIHHSEFPDCIFGGSRVYDSVTQYRFTIRS